MTSSGESASNLTTPTRRVDVSARAQGGKAKSKVGGSRAPNKALAPHAAPYFDDLFVGQEFPTAGLTVTEDAIVRFAIEWDFQSFHVDRVAAAESAFGGIVASGLHTLAVTMRLCVSAGLFTGTVVAGFEWGRIRLSQPVRPGDTLRAVVTVRSMRRSRSRPHLGVVSWRVRAYNQRGEAVLETTATNLLTTRRGEHDTGSAPRGTPDAS